MRISADEVPQPKPGTTITHVVILKSGDTAWMPGTTKNVFHGPGKVEYKVYPDGGVDAKRLG